MDKKEGQRRCFEKLKSVGLFAQYKDYGEFEKREQNEKEKRKENRILKQV